MDFSEESHDISEIPTHPTYPPQHPQNPIHDDGPTMAVGGAHYNND